MDTASQIARCEKEIEAVRQELLELGAMHPGSISQQYHVCGTPTCHCHHPTDPQKHGPYSKLTYVHRGKPACRFVRETDLDEMRARLAAYKRFRALVDKWIALSIEKASAEFFPSTGRRRDRSSAKTT